MTILLASLALAMTSSPLTLWFKKPAENYIESCPVGNGRLGGMMFGGIDKDRVVLNEQTMWSGSVQDSDREDAHKTLPEIRALLLAGKNKEAQDLLSRTFLAKGNGSDFGAGKDGRYGCYQVLGDLTLAFPKTGEPSSYRRELDLDSATAKLTYEIGDVKFTRELFASAPDHVLVYRISASKPGQVSFTAKISRRERATVQTESNDLLMFGELNNGTDGHGTAYQARMRAKAIGGTVSVTSDGIKVDGASTVDLYVTAGTTFYGKAFAAQNLDHLNSATVKPYDQLHAAQMADHRKFFRRVSLDLPAAPGGSISTPERVEGAKRGEDDPSLAALYFQFGRYLLIGSSRPDSVLPANLQGIWADEYQTAWNGDFHTDINVQMNYWPAEPTNLSDCAKPLMHFINGLVEPGSKTAKAYYDANGWVCHVITNPWGFTSPGEGASWGSTCTGGGWLCEHLWDHYAFTKDRVFLKEAYPTMRAAAEFFLDFLIQEPSHGWLVTAPSNSPENSYKLPNGDVLNTCMGPAMDIQIVRELFTNTIAASAVLKTDGPFRAKLVAARDRLAPHQIGRHGQLQEWLEDYEEGEPHHRHVSNLYALYPSNQISPKTTPGLAKAARVTLERRGDESTGWSMAWKVCFWSRLGDGDHANKLLKLLIGRGSPNLFCLHPPFQIDGNFGGTAGIAEMLLQSQTDVIELLPALPSTWKSGSVKGLKARGNFTVDIDWADGKVNHYRVHSSDGSKAKVRVNGKIEAAS